MASENRQRAEAGTDFQFPYFYNYHPYFTLQPVRDTREKQIQLWKDLILKYCKHKKIFLIDLEEDFALFNNASIQRKLSHEARETFLGALITEGCAEWLDKGHKKCLVLWWKVPDWADLILQFVRENGLEKGVMTIEEIRSGDDTCGTELQGINRKLLVKALKLLQHRGKATIFKGKNDDDDGVKFSAQM